MADALALPNFLQETPRVTLLSFFSVVVTIQALEFTQFPKLVKMYVVYLSKL